MIDQDRPVIGGFGGSIRSMMSPGLQRRLAEQEAAEAREAKEQERFRAQRAEAHHEASIQAAIAQALEQGQEFNPRMLRGEGLGRTRAEAIQYYSAMQDREDVLAAAREQLAFRRWQAEQAALYSGDASADTIQAERAEAQWRQDQRARNQVARGKELRRRQIIEDAREASLGDTAKVVAGLARAVDRDRRGY
jgi:hypothetical protein